MFRLFKLGYAVMVQLFIQNRIIWIQKSVCVSVCKADVVRVVLNHVVSVWSREK